MSTPRSASPGKLAWDRNKALAKFSALLSDILKGFVANVFTAPASGPADFLYGGVGVQLGDGDRFTESGDTEDAAAVG